MKPADQAVCSAAGTPPPKVRSRLTNGTTTFLGRVDGRSALARRQRDLVQAFSAELTAEQGGAITATRRARIGQLAALQCRAEQLHAAVARGEPIDDAQLVRLSNVLRREMADLGLSKRGESEPADEDAFVALINGR